jgi:hypothetical protein
MMIGRDTWIDDSGAFAQTTYYQSGYLNERGCQTDHNWSQK